jgi:8-oxo-dGTP pyrophosphatase MutT (NUDIX family)
MADFVLGFLFNKRKSVALIRKTHPRWQAGKYNGVGGHVIKGESTREAMVREFLEETGACVPDWRLFCVITKFPDTVYCFTAQGDYSLKSLTDEKVNWYYADSIQGPDVLASVTWLVPMALENQNMMAKVEYSLLTSVENVV